MKGVVKFFDPSLVPIYCGFGLAEMDGSIKFAIGLIQVFTVV
jgi:hypothetical protein